MLKTINVINDSTLYFEFKGLVDKRWRPQKPTSILSSLRYQAKDVRENHNHSFSSLVSIYFEGIY
jgi:hypothetical protein